MLFILIDYDEPFAPWLAPYLLGFVLLAILAYLFKFFQNWYSLKYNRPLYRDLFVYKKINEKQTTFLNDKFLFYQKLSSKNKKRFRHRVATFMNEKKFIGRENVDFDEELKLKIAANACMLSFGRKNYKFKLIEVIILFPEKFYSDLIDDFRTKEFNPQQKAVVFSCENLQKMGNRNPIVFEFMHALQLEAKISSDMDSQRFSANYQKILHQLLNAETKSRLEKTLLKEYPFTNQFEFMGVLAESFFEQRDVFKRDFPELYENIRKILGYEDFGSNSTRKSNA